MPFSALLFAFFEEFFPLNFSVASNRPQPLLLEAVIACQKYSGYVPKTMILVKSVRYSANFPLFGGERKCHYLTNNKNEQRLYARHLHSICPSRFFSTLTEIQERTLTAEWLRLQARSTDLVDVCMVKAVICFGTLPFTCLFKINFVRLFKDNTVNMGEK